MASGYPIGEPVASAPGRYCEWCAINPNTFSQADLDAVVAEGVKRSPPRSKFNQVLHLGADGLVMVSLKNKGMVLHVRREHIVRFAMGGAPGCRQALVIMVGNGSGMFAAHVVDMEPSAVELMVEAGEVVLQRLWRASTPMAIPPGRRGGHYEPLKPRLVDMSSRPEDDQTVLVLSPRPGQTYGFMFSTNMTDLLGGVNHYVSSVDAKSAAAAAGMRAGDRIISINRVDVRDMPHAAVVSMVRQSMDTPSQPTLEVVVAGPNKVIRDSIRQKGRKLRLSHHTPAVVTLGVGHDFAPAGPPPDLDESSTDIELQYPGGVPDEQLGSTAPNELAGVLFGVSAGFAVPEGSPPFDLFADGREMVDVGLFRCRATRPMTAAVVVCNDVIVVTEVRHRDDPVGHYVLAVEPADREVVTASVDEEDPCVFHVELSPQCALTLWAPTPEECSEWAQILNSPTYAGPIDPDLRGSREGSRRGRGQRTSRTKRLAGGRGGGNGNATASSTDADGVGDGGDDDHHHGNDTEGHDNNNNNQYHDGEEHDDDGEPHGHDNAGQADDDDHGHHETREHEDAAMDTRDGDGEGLGMPPRPPSPPQYDAVVMHCAMSKDEVAALMDEQGRSDGMFLFRPYLDTDDVVLSVVYKTKVTHHKLALEDNVWTLLRKGTSKPLNDAATLDDVRIYLAEERDFWPAPLITQVLPPPGRSYEDQQRAAESTAASESQEPPPLPHKVTLSGKTGTCTFINGDYLLEMDGDNEPSRPVYRHKEAEVYMGAVDEEEAVPVYLWYSEPNASWVIGPVVDGNEVIGFCNDAHLEPGMPPQGPGGWHFLHQRIDSEEVDPYFTVTYSDGVDSTPM
eukprot:m.170563 g.170563  ORF g.170563 m.170563 type:complete len:848 (-) comp13259_c0_seq1:77-2620(-)